MQRISTIIHLESCCQHLEIERVLLVDWRQRLPNKRDVLILTLLFLLPVISFSELFFSSKTLYRADITWVHYPMAIFKARLLRSGQIPFWNPHILFGFPQMADQDVLAFYPLNVFFLLPLKPYFTLSCFSVAHFFLAGILSYVMARSLQISRVGAFITAVTFALSGYLMAQLTNLPIMTGSVWLPLILFFLVKALQTMSPTYAVLCGGAIALQIFASHPQATFNSFFTLGSYGSFRLIRLWRSSEMTIEEKRTKIIVLLSLLVIAVLVGLGLAVIQIAPTLELKGWSPRSAGLSYRTMTSYSLPPDHLLTFLFPNILGNPVIGYKGEDNFEEMHAYVGILPLMLIPWAWAKRKQDDHVTFFSILALVSLLLALGRYTPLYHLLVYIPGFNFFRVPARWLFTVTFSFSTLAGYGFDVLVKGHKRAESRFFAAFWRVLSWLNLAITLLMLACLALGQQIIQPLNNLRGVFSEQTLERLLLLLHGLTQLPLIKFSDSLSMTLSSLNPALLFVLLSNAGFLVIYLWNRRRITATTFQVVVVSLTVVDLLLTGGTTVNPVREASYYSRQFGSTAFLQQNCGLYRIYPTAAKGEKDVVENLLEDIPTMYGLYSVFGHAALPVERHKTFVRTMRKSAALFNLAGVKYVLLEEDPGYPGYVRAYVGSDFEIYENESVLPRSFIVHHAEVIPSEQAVLDRLLSEDFDPSRTVILAEEPPPSFGQDGLPSEPDLHGAEITSYSPHQVVIEADLQADGFLVLSDTYYPGWKVYVDGREDKIYQADYLFRAVFLKQGRHVVEFRYNPLSFRIGLAISLATGAILCAMAMYGALTYLRQRG
jgi:heme exporter protein D